MTANDAASGLLTLTYLAIVTIALIPGLSRRLANILYANSVAVETFWRWQAGAFAAYAAAFRKALKEAAE
jgi:hypothetical protein